MAFTVFILFASCLLFLLLPRSALAAEQVLTPVPNILRGFYDEALEVTLYTATPGAQIRYTLDGSSPRPEHGDLYEHPIRIETTTVLSAIAYRPDGSLAPSSVVVHTYIFVNHVAQQEGRPRGYPRYWSEYLADYDMDSEIVENPAYRDQIRKALLSIPSVSLVLKRSHLFDDEHGLYQNTHRTGPGAERPTSMEILYPSNSVLVEEDGSQIKANSAQNIQIHAGIRIQGSDSRQAHKSPKHSFRLLFKRTYGEGKLKHNLFADVEDKRPAIYRATDEFDTLVLRAGYNNSWLQRSARQRMHAQYLRDQWMRDTQRAMGHVSANGFHVHLYINGIYWGLYNLHERPSAPFQASYFGGIRESYDVLNTGHAIDGDRAAWNQMMGLAAADLANPTAYQAIQEYLDLVNFADYMILNQYAGNTDWDDNNWYAARRRVPGAGFRFFSWDAEKTLVDLDEDRTKLDALNLPSGLFNQLMRNTDFRILFADRVYQHFFNHGALSVHRNIARYQTLSADINDAIVAESARWGDYRRDVHRYSEKPYELYTRNNQWVRERTRLLESYFPRRTQIVLQQYRTRGWYPPIDPPHLSHPGGEVPLGYRLSIIAPEGQPGSIWYTLDGRDPRAADAEGGISQQEVGRFHGGREVHLSIQETMVVRTRLYDETTGTWSAERKASFLPSIGNVSGLQITELMVHPPAGTHHEYIELQNHGSKQLDIGGIGFTNGIHYIFPAGSRLDSGQLIVIAKNPVLFQERYGFAPSNQVGYQGSLDNDGERLTLRDLQGNEILTVRYEPALPRLAAANGAGFSLVLDGDKNQTTTQTSEQKVGDHWRVSTYLGGSPLAIDPLLSTEVNPQTLIGGILINEVLPSQTSTQDGFVELYNTTPDAIQIGEWFLTDQLKTPTKYQIPVGTLIAGHGYWVIPEPELGFPLNLDSETIYLLSGRSGALTGYSDSLSFRHAPPGQSVGRCVVEQSVNGDSTMGRGSVASNLRRHSYLALQPVTTPGKANGRPHVGPIVISELMYNAQTNAEYIELTNLTTQPVSLFEPASPHHPWRIDGINFNLPPGTQIPSRGSLLVTSTDPATFRTGYEVSNHIVILGPYPGKLDNGGERIALERPIIDGRMGRVRYVEVDAVAYDDDAPWPERADGDGWSLERILLHEYGGAAFNWRQSVQLGGTPGTTSLALSEQTQSNAISSSYLFDTAPLQHKILLPVIMNYRPSPQANHCFTVSPR